MAVLERKLNPVTSDLFKLMFTPAHCTGPLAIVVDPLEEAFHGGDVFRRQCEVVTERSHGGFAPLEW